MDAFSFFFLDSGFYILFDDKPEKITGKPRRFPRKMQDFRVLENFPKRLQVNPKEGKPKDLNICLNINIHMSIKTITITEDAYDSIKRLKGTDESFSELFLRISSEKKTIKDLLGAVKIDEKEASEIKKRILSYRKKASKDIEERRKNVCFG